MRSAPSDIAFTTAVKQTQKAKGSRERYARMERRRGWQTDVTPELAEFLADLDMYYLGTANAAGQPYIQYRGGQPGFLKVIDQHTVGFADFGGDRQYITLGNLSENPKAFTFLVDYARAGVSSYGAPPELSRMMPSCSSDLPIRVTPRRSSARSCSTSRRGTSIVPSTFNSDSPPARSAALRGPSESREATRGGTCSKDD